MPEALYKKLNITKEELVNKIKQLYNSGLSQAKIAQELNCNITCIEGYFKEFKLISRNHSECMKICKERHCEFNSKENEIIIGLLLSDFHIAPEKFQGRFTFGFKHKEFAEYIINNINSIEWGELYEYKPKNSPNINYFGKSRYYTELLELRNKWYKNNKKTVPRDIILTPDILHWWYLGDGYLETRKYGLFLCTESFTKEDNEFLVNQLNKIGFSCFLTRRNRIRFSGKDGIKKFLNYIGKSKVKCYEYKWKTS